MLEQDFQQALRVEITRALPALRLWRQPSGRVVAARGGAVECAPVGAADLSGIVRPEGWRVEVEVKGAHTPETDDQRRWRAFIAEAGGVALQVRYVPSLSLDANVARGVELVREAIAARRAR